MRTLQTVATGVLALCFGSALALAFDFPSLTGPVVDQADILTVASRSDIAAKSTALQDKSGIQLVVATVRSLEGSDIESYANQLFRTWQLGQAQKNNGVLLLVAPAEHKVRIEVGYGLEGTLTDALCSAIIAGAIVPRFKDNDFPGGIGRGVDGIVSVLSGDTTDWQPRPPPQSFTIDIDKLSAKYPALPILGFLATAIVLGLLLHGIAWLLHAIGLIKRPGRYVKRDGRMVFVPVRSSSRSTSSWGDSDSSSSSSSSSDSYSGGGGSSGGGGASGSW
jgi:uncharacterized protein